MKRVKVIGGLGNQMFQYAFYEALKEKYNDVFLDVTNFNGYGLHNGYELEKIFKNIGNVKKYEKKKFYNNYFFSRIYKRIFKLNKKNFIEKYFYYFEKEVFSKSAKIYYGYWQSEKYFINLDNLIREKFKFSLPEDEKNKMLLEEIKNSESISIHVRRGDYVNHKTFGGICEIDYYIKAINILKKEKKEKKWYIFSNDLNWCNENIIPLLKDESVKIVDWNKGENSYLDMQLMSECKDNIIANSSFSWWAAWLNRNMNKKVICPQKWGNNIPTNHDILPNNWIKI